MHIDEVVRLGMGDASRVQLENEGEQLKQQLRFLAFWLCLSAVFQFVSAVICWKVYKLMQAQTDQVLTGGLYADPSAASEMSLRPSGSGAERPSNLLPLQPPRSSGGAAAAPPRVQRPTTAPVAPFQGTGHRLGDD
eukprot:gnl/TRDRNA2_/TRDRNA2_154135_c1_seq1.p1 gnl/TRDRNA2_/TRDRNA2_154135_c1~~gnl/TRDRNA2_/TRDRNA2_154135_c1_seq1.p1  ORF type:complete len:136 (-),score=23.39 gnl/TRDRNA2_/TRDRNA2_154135_c1_seq1:83-490(-)